VRKMVLVLGILLFCSAAHAQNVPAFKNYQTRWLFDSEIGSEETLGFKLPHLAFGASFEQPVGKHFELQGGVSYSPDKKVNNGGQSFSTDALVIGWVRNGLGILGKVHSTNLWTPQYDKHAITPSFGSVFRVHEFGFAGRLYLDYVLPTGCTHCQIQGSRLQGVEAFNELKLWPHVRTGIKFGFYTFLEQGNPLSDQPRIRDIGGISTLVIRFVPRSEDVSQRY
jgi:hypothetical protein